MYRVGVERLFHAFVAAVIGAFAMRRALAGGRQYLETRAARRGAPAKHSRYGCALE
jgi:hypothetical protein